MKKYTLGFITGILIALTALVATDAFAFSISRWRDVISGSWYEAAVNDLGDIGVVSGYPDGTFKPSNKVTRAEAAQMLEKMKQYVDARVEGKLIPKVSSSIPVASESNPQNTLLVSASNNSCSALTTPKNYNEVVVSNIDELTTAIALANSTGNVVITIKNGTYILSKDLWISGDNIMIRSQSGKRDDVILKGQGMRGVVASVFHLMGDNDVVENVTVGWVANHPIQIHGELDADNPVIHNVRFVDGYEQLLKVSYDAAHVEKGSDNGIVECSLFEYSVGIGPQFYIGGVDAHNAKNWIVRGNTFKNIRSPDVDLAEHAIHFWSNSQGTLVENNVIINSDRGIGFGLGDRGHIGGIIRNNFIYHDANSRGDVGIVLESAPGAQVYGNKIYLENDYKNAIEYRFGSTTGVSIHDNISNKAIASRDGATGIVANNTTDATRQAFEAELGNF